MGDTFHSDLYTTIDVSIWSKWIPQMISCQQDLTLLYPTSVAHISPTYCILDQAARGSAWTVATDTTALCCKVNWLMRVFETSHGPIQRHATGDRSEN